MTPIETAVLAGTIQPGEVISGPSLIPKFTGTTQYKCVSIEEKRTILCLLFEGIEVGLLSATPEQGRVTLSFMLLKEAADYELRLRSL